MITICFDTCYNKCTIPFADANLFMNDERLSQHMKQEPILM